MLITRWQEFGDRLCLPVSRVHELRNRYQIGVVTVYELFREILEEWKSRFGNDANVQHLLRILQEMGFGNLFDRISERFDLPHHSSHEASFVTPEYLKLFTYKNLKPLERLDIGTFGEVFKARSDQAIDGLDYAVKTISVAKFIAGTQRAQGEVHDYLTRMLREVKTLAKVEDTSNIVRYYDSWFLGPLAAQFRNYLSTSTNALKRTYNVDKNGNPITTDEEEKTFLVIKMELCHQSLQQWMAGNLKPSIQVVQNFIGEILNGLRTMHNLGIIHRDMKPNNVLLLDDSKGGFVVKLGDFGLARDFLTDGTLTNKVGCDTYRSPEMVNNLGYDFKTDIYSLGIIYLLMLHHFQSEDHQSLAVLSIRLGLFSTLDEIEKEMGYQISHLRAMLKKDPAERSSAEELYNIFHLGRKKY